MRYFTAPALGRFATHAEQAKASQDRYHRALEHVSGERLTITRGMHTYDKSGSLLPRYVDGQPFDRNDRVRVWKIEEKQTDVNIALAAMYRDAACGRFHQLVVCSNDSDIAPVLCAIRQDFPHIRLAVIAPRYPPDSGTTMLRALSASLD